MRYAAVGLVAALVVVGGFGGAAATPNLIQREAYLMGTQVRLLAWEPARADGLARLERALDVLEQAEAELSTWRSDSAVSELNRAPLGTPWSASSDLCATLTVVEQWQNASRGAFDPAIGPLVSAWDIHGNGRVPAPPDLLRARALSGWQNLGFDATHCTATRRSDVTLDVGAFGKGDALDRTVRVMGQGSWLIDLGGQIVARGGPPGEGGWPVAIADPQERTHPVLHVSLREGSLATSGRSERELVVEGRRIGHILDPRTGQPAPFDGTVTVWHQRALVADMLSTALFVLGPVDGLSWAASHGVEVCYLERDDGGEVHVTMTDGFHTLVTS